MATLSATPKWRLPILVVPGLGTVRHPRNGILQVDESTAAWLIEQGYAVAASQPEAPPIPLGDPITLSTETLPESWETIALRFVQTEDETRLAAVKGISPQKAKELTEHRPENWEALKDSLTNSQLKAIQAHVAQPKTPDL
jgi:hypothetical protein